MHGQTPYHWSSRGQPRADGQSASPGVRGTWRRTQRRLGVAIATPRPALRATDVGATALTNAPSRRQQLSLSNWKTTAAHPLPLAVHRSAVTSDDNQGGSDHDQRAAVEPALAEAHLRQASAGRYRGVAASAGDYEREERVGYESAGRSDWIRDHACRPVRVMP